MSGPGPQRSWETEGPSESGCQRSTSGGRLSASVLAERNTSADAVTHERRGRCTVAAVFMTATSAASAVSALGGLAAPAVAMHIDEGRAEMSIGGGLRAHRHSQFGANG